MNFYGGSGTPLSTYVNTINQIPVFVNGRGDMGRTPIFTQTDLLVAHEFKFTEAKRLRFEFNALNLFNQKTSRHRFNNLNRGAGAARQSSAIDLSNVDLAKGYDYRALILQSPEGAFAFDPRYGLDGPVQPGLLRPPGCEVYFLNQWAGRGPAPLGMPESGIFVLGMPTRRNAHSTLVRPRLILKCL